MENNFDDIINERANHLFEIMAQRATAEELELIKEIVQFTREAYASYITKNGKPYCLEVLESAKSEAEAQSLDADYVVAVMVFPIFEYHLKCAGFDEISGKISGKTYDLIFDTVEALRRLRSSENWSEPVYLPELANTPSSPYTKDEIRGSISFNKKSDVSTKLPSDQTMKTEQTLNDNTGSVNQSATIKECIRLRNVNRRSGPLKEDIDLYEKLMTKSYYKSSGFSWEKQFTEGMQRVECLVNGYWKPRYLLDHQRKVAYEVLDGNMHWKYFGVDDIDWESLKGLDESAIERARQLSARYPSFIRSFDEGAAIVEWQLNPDGMYWMDSDGYGMTDDDEIAVFAVVDRDLNVLVKFRYIGSDYKQLKLMEEEAKNALKMFEYQ